MKLLSIFFEPLSSRRTTFMLLLFALLQAGCSTSPDSPDTSKPPVDGRVVATSYLALCPTTVSNPPSASALQGSGLVCTNEVELQLAPAPGACLSSGFGQRSGRLHKGIDYQSRPAGAVVAAAEGKILDVKFRREDFGHWVIIDHGRGVYTSYAHLANVDNKITAGAVVRRGQALGIMGQSGDSARAIHLHFELRSGDYGNPKGWWGLTPVDPFTLAARCG